MLGRTLDCKKYRGIRCLVYFAKVNLPVRNFAEAAKKGRKFCGPQKFVVCRALRTSSAKGATHNVGETNLPCFANALRLGLTPNHRSTGKGAGGGSTDCFSRGAGGGIQRAYGGGSEDTSASASGCTKSEVRKWMCDKLRLMDVLRSFLQFFSGGL